MYTIPEIKAIVEKSIIALNLNKEPEELYNPIGYILSIGGKRIRPRLCLMAYNLFSSDISQSIIYPAMALEIFHAFTLIHDDIMDNADMRRGQLTIHKKWNNNIAILSGDVMSIKAYEYLSYAPVDKLAPALCLFNKTAAEVCEGQQFDMNYENKPVITMEDYLSMIGLKTAVLIACSAKMGALIGGASETAAQALYDYGYQLGMAFQITDDYLDVYGDPAIFGKKIGGDIINNKKSWLLVESMKCATGEDAIKLAATMKMGEENGPEKIELMKSLYNKLEIDTKAEQAIEKYYRAAIGSLDTIELKEEKKELLKEFGLMITTRNK